MAFGLLFSGPPEVGGGLKAACAISFRRASLPSPAPSLIPPLTNLALDARSES